MTLPKPRGVIRPDFVFIDVEASALLNGYPIEIGICDDALNTHSWLVQPDESWEKLNWDDQAQQVHGLSQAKLVAEGLPAGQVVREFSMRVSPGHAVFSDNPSHDWEWLQRLFWAAGGRIAPELTVIDQASFDAVDPSRYEHLMLTREEEALALANKHWPHIHRAGPDARNMAAYFRLLVDDDFFQEVSEWDRLRSGPPRLGVQL